MNAQLPLLKARRRQGPWSERDGTCPRCRVLLVLIERGEGVVCRACPQCWGEYDRTIFEYLPRNRGASHD